MASSDRAFLSPQEFAALSGLSIATVRRRIRDGQLPVFQPGGRRTRTLIPAEVLASRGDRDPTDRSGGAAPSPEAQAAAGPATSTPRRRGPRPRLGRSGGSTTGEAV